MKFFHVYNEEYYDGLIKNGLINKDSGFKIQHVYLLPDEMKFNQLAAKDSMLYNIIKEGKHPFYVDRIAGGCAYHYYSFDKNLIDEYKKILGDWFLGFQLHESGSNRRRAEWKNLMRIMGSKGPYDLEELKTKMVHRNAGSFINNRIPMYNFSQDTPEYYATKTYAETHDGFIEEMKELFSRRMKDTYGNVLPCDSYYLATKLQADLGMNSFMPEVGCQIPLMRIAVALARGMAKAYNKTWGTYYECWREVPEIKDYTMPCLNKDMIINEWYGPEEDIGPNYGENGGSSRLLQKRIYYYSLMSGADYISEEWGLSCTYANISDFALSSYGQCKKEFIDTTQKLQNIKAVVPFAIVMPKRYSCIELPEIYMPYEIGKHNETYLESPLSKKDQAYFGHIEDVLKLFFARTEPVGNEGHVITNSRFGDLFDIIYEDAPDSVLAQYDYLIDATPAGDFAKAKAGSNFKVLLSGEIEKLAAEVTALSQRVMSCTVDGLHWLVSQDDTGKHYLTIFNNEGNERDIHQGDIIHHESDKKITIRFKEATEVSVVMEFQGSVGLEKVDETTYCAIVPATGFVILAY